jgi:hypothetical protein
MNPEGELDEARALGGIGKERPFEMPPMQMPIGDDTARGHR